ncbi:MAG: hypothetical protein H7061_07195 [Bdellovibrionaceae bacterium]|nr:hypothetical protein [Bdellovibrio sp.]
MNKFLIIAFVAIFGVGFNSFADMLLVPEQAATFNLYQAACLRPGYLCTNLYTLDQNVKKETPLFDELINSVDLSSKIYLQKFNKDFLNILQKEMLSEDQLELTLKLISQVKDLIENKNQLASIENDLKAVKEVLSKAPDVSQSERFVIFFKKPVAESDFKKIKTTLLKMPAVVVQFNQVPQDFNTRQALRPVAIPVLTGQCEKAELAKELIVTAWQPYHAQNCSLTESFSAATMAIGSTMSQNKKWLITGALIIGAALLLNQYEVQFQF